MYTPPAFREDDLQAQHELIRAYPLAMIVTSGPAGLIASPLPCLLYAEGEFGTLRFHLARANPQVAELRAAHEVLAIFQGPERYIRPGWYPTKEETGKVVPTWNYVTVHVWGTPHVTDDAAWLRRQVEDLTDFNESRRPRPWKVSDAPDSFIAAQLKGITGVELPISRIIGKWKVSQNRAEADRRGVADGLVTEGESAAAMAAVVRERSDRSSTL